MMNSTAHWLENAGTHTLRIAIIAIIAIILIRILKALTKRLVHISKAHTRIAQMREEQTRTMAGVLYSVGAAMITAVAILMALPEFGFNVTPVEAAAAVASLAFGFGAQSLVKDFINGFFIVFEDQYVVGDLIDLNGQIGRVEYLTLRRTVLRGVSGAIVTIPNSLVGQVANLNRDWSQAFVDVTVPSAEAVGRALTLLEKIATEFRQDAAWTPALVDGPRVLGIEALSLDGTVLRLQVRTVLNRKDDVARELRRRIRLAFEEVGVPLSHTHKIDLHGAGAPQALSAESATPEPR
jgi:small-conductance mechanosensitive channel